MVEIICPHRILESNDSEKLNMAKVQVPFQGKKVAGETVDFEVEKESWNVYALEDGTKLKMRTVLSQVVRLENQYNAQGDPVYFVMSQNVLNTEVPDHLKQEPPGNVN
jgi:hypothetical protein